MSNHEERHLGKTPLHTSNVRCHRRDKPTEHRNLLYFYNSGFLPQVYVILRSNSWQCCDAYGVWYNQPSFPKLGL